MIETVVFAIVMLFACIGGFTVGWYIAEALKKL